MKVSLVGLNIGGNPPLGLGYLKAFADADPRLARKVDIRIHGYDFFTLPETIVADLVREAPRVIGLNLMHGSVRKVLRIAEGLKALLPQSVVVLGGVEAGPVAEKLLAHGPQLDLVVCGEGEATFAELLLHAQDGAALPALAGTAAREDGRPVRRPDRPPLDLSTVPSPYLSGALDPEGFAAVHIETYRGCAYHCAYCFEGRGFAGPRLFPEEMVREELRFVLSKSPRPTKFYDTTFNQFRTRTLRILEDVARFNSRGHQLGAEVRMEAFDREFSQAAARARLLDIETGLQSANDQTLATLQRTTDRRAFELNVRNALAAGLRVIVHIMAALPGDRLTDTLRAHDYVLSLGAEPCLFHTRILPGTPLAEEAARRGIVFVSEPNYDVLTHATFSLADHQRYNRFGLMRTLLGPWLAVVFRTAESTRRPPSELVEEFCEALAGWAPWQSLVARYRFWDSGADPAFQAEVSLLREQALAPILACVEKQTANLSRIERTALLSLLGYLGTLDRICRLPAPAMADGPQRFFAAPERLTLAKGVALFQSPVDLGLLLARPESKLAELSFCETRLLIQRTPTGSLTKVINPEMERLLRLFVEPLSVHDALAAWLPPVAPVEHRQQLLAILNTLRKEGTLIPNREPLELARGKRLVVRTLTAADEAAVYTVYRQNHRFFRAIAGVDEPTQEHIQSDIEDAPPGYEAGKNFLGIALADSGELIGVADLLAGYPKPGEACFGLLLLSERHQSQGLGREAASLVESWAQKHHAIRRITVGVELANQPACRFWRACGYQPTGEHFSSSALGQDNEAELLVKDLADRG